LPKLPWRAVFAGTLTGLLAAAGLQTCLLLLRNNLHVVVPGRVYRSSQLNGPDLDQVIHRHGIRTIINLRGLCPELDLYMDESRVSHQAGVSLVDIGFSAGRLPPVNELRYLIKALDRSEYPILLHCRQGVDRTGLVSTLVLLLYTDTGLDEALRQLGLRYGHISLGRTGYMDRFFELYREWLQDQGLQHSRKVFRRWLEKEYCAGACSCALEPLDVPRRVLRGQPWAARFRARNTSAQTWHLRPVPSSGFHLGYMIIDDGFGCAAMGRAGLLEAFVSRGEMIDIAVAVPALKQPGRYTLLVDMVDEQQGWFYQHGGEPLECRFEVE
jgi:protein tyrosine phosphatase (PTP) superfamily phosphohydrolase (DUF442 family)